MRMQTVDEARRELTRWTDDAQIILARVSRVFDEHETLQIELDGSQAHGAELREQIGALEAESSALRGQISVHESLGIQLRGRISALEADNAAFRERLETLQARLALRLGVVRNSLIVNGGVFDVGPLRLRHLLPFAESLESKAQEEVGLPLASGNCTDRLFA
jgi:predicted nuclease with TOPRIM domain